MPPGCGADEGTVVEPGALGSVCAAQPLPPVLRHQGDRVSSARSPPAASGTPSSRARPIIFRASAGFVANATFVADPGGPAAAPVVRPLFGQAQLPVDQRPPAVRRDVGREHGDQAVLHAARGAGVHAGHAGRHAALLQEPCLVDRQHGGRGRPSTSRHTLRPRPARRPRPVVRSSAAAASRPATRRPGTPPAARSSSAPRATAGPAGTPGRAAAPSHSRKLRRPA